ncbi:MAG: hypothetical protein RLZZ264_562, partial [Bacillota bacterium]
MFLTKFMNSKTESLALTIDFGTQSVRVSIFNRQGEILAIKKHVYQPTYESSKPGYAEHDASFYWDNLKKVTFELKKDHPELLRQVTTAAMTVFRGTAIMLDQDKKPVRKVILWLDQRLAKFEPFSLFHNIAYHFLGLYQTAKLNSRRTMARWVRQNEPETWKRVRYYVALSTYFNYLLTDQLTDSAANMIGHYPLDFITSKWYKPTHVKAAVFNIPLSMLVPLKKPGDLLGRITKKASAEL